ncbi:MAG: peptidoglycan DD-metalloendopeptidase family protein [Clostridia bacterium]|nr:peptidoglycan DD-metalloendopeptidase family protein [Clostridia bacterium]
MRRTKKTLRLIAVLAACIMLITSSGLSAAASNLTNSEQQKIDDYKKQAAAYQEKIDENKGKLDTLKGDIDKQKEYVDTLNDQIDAYQKEIDALNASIAALETEKAGIQAKVDELTEQIGGIQTDIDKNEQEQEGIQGEINDTYSELQQRIRDIYVYGRTSDIELLLNSTDFKSFLITMELSSSMAKRDNELITGLKDKISEIDALIEQKNKLIADLDVKRSEHETEINALDVKEQDLQNSTDSLLSSQEEVNVLQSEAMEYLSELDHESDEYKALLANYEANIDAFEKEIDDILAAAAARRAAEEAAAAEAARKAAEASGSNSSSSSSSSSSDSSSSSSSGQTTRSSGSGLIWPLQYSDVYISSPYGYRSDPATGVTKLHGGTDTCCWSGTYGKAVSAAASGTVIIATYSSSGYGNYVAIDHGGGIVTLYGHNSSLNVHVGQYVNQGDTIAYAGATGYATGAHVHFEVRVNGNKVNPMNYFPGGI